MIKWSVLIVLSSFMSCGIASVNSHFAKIKSDPNALYAFFKVMPKGGELHYHLSGGVYAETLLALAAHADYCINNSTMSAEKNLDCDDIETKDLVGHPDTYNRIIRAWSMKNFIPGKQSNSEHFFEIFFKLNTLVFDFSAQVLAEIMKRASSQHELYLEIMIMPDNASSANFANLIKGPIGFAAKTKILLSNQDFQKNISFSVAEGSRILAQARTELGCDTLALQAVCGLTVKFQYNILRNQSLDRVFAQALNNFASAAQSNEIVAINLVQDESNVIALRDYRDQMRIIKFLHAEYPSVRIALHAGELAPQDVSPAELRTHIHDAIFIAKTERIGHGIDIAYEKNSANILKYMAKKAIPVEINLTSNQEVLGIAGVYHPFKYYLSHLVPVVLSTDDEGILRTDLTREYVRAVIEHGLNYDSIKNINRNALTYSFLRGKSLWVDAARHIAVAPCRSFRARACLAFIQAHEKARLQWRLERELDKFEKRFS